MNGKVAVVTGAGSAPSAFQSVVSTGFAEEGGGPRWTWPESYEVCSADVPPSGRESSSIGFASLFGGATYARHPSALPSRTSMMTSASQRR